MRKDINIAERIEHRFQVIRVGVAILIALMLTLTIILFISEEPWSTFYSFIFGPFASISRLGNIVEKMIPLLFTGTGVAIMYSGGQINMASEGAFFLGGVSTAYFAIKLSLPTGIHPVVCMIIGGVVGAMVTSIPALMYVKFGALPVVSSLMINYVCLFLGLWVINYVIRDPAAGYLASFVYPETSKLPILVPKTNVHFGLIIAILVILFGYLFLQRSKKGYEIRIMGMNKEFARYSGTNF